MDRYYEYRHVVGFEDTNLVANVYYVRYLSWQGRCREMFLFEHAPEVLEDLRGGLKLFTIRAECDYFVELSAFDELSIRMRLSELTQTQLAFTFDFVRVHGAGEVLAARGGQRVACMRGSNGQAAPTRVPEALRAALEPFAPPSPRLTGATS